MGGVARAELAAAVCEAGGFGFMGMVREPVSLITSEVNKLRALTQARFGINLIPAATDPALLSAQVDACLGLKVPVVALFWDLAEPVIRRLRANGVTVVCQVGSVAEAKAAELAGAEILIAQGVEAGGHVRASAPLHELLPEIVETVRVPVLAAGGLATGQDLVKVISLGAQGGVFGTAFIATPESFAHDYHRARILKATSADTVLTKAFHINWPPNAPVRVIANSVTRGERGDPFGGERRVIGDEEGRPIYLFSTDSPSRAMTGEFETMALYAGCGVDAITDVVPARARLDAIVREAVARLGMTAQNEAPELASPACSAREMDDAYMGFLTPAELAVALNELLEAERAGARVALATLHEACGPEMSRVVREIQHDESRWAALLNRIVQTLGEAPSNKTGAFFAKAMAIADIEERLRFINRGQGWVVRKLRELLPRVRDDAIHADLSKMLDGHVEKIDRVDQLQNASFR
jgi:nitronate monooxygenase